jgi:hypothetical protein
MKQIIPPPDLQELVAKHGGYIKITPKAWSEWDKANAEWQAERRARLGRELQAARERKAGCSDAVVHYRSRHHGLEPRKARSEEPAPAIVNNFFGYCACGNPGLYHAYGAWFCNACRPERWVPPAATSDP